MIQPHRGMHPLQYKRLADICEKLGVALFAGALLPSFFPGMVGNITLVSRILDAGLGFVFPAVSVRLSQEEELKITEGELPWKQRYSEQWLSCLSSVCGGS